MGILAGLGKSLVGTSNYLQEQEELALRRALQDQQMKIAADANARAGELHTQNLDKLKYEASRRPVDQALKELDMLMKLDPTGWVDNPQAVDLATKGGLPLPKLDLASPEVVRPQIEQIERGQFANMLPFPESPAGSMKAIEQQPSGMPFTPSAPIDLSFIEKEFGASPQTGLRIPQQVTAARQEQQLRDKAMGREFKSPLSESLDYHSLTGANPPATMFEQGFDAGRNIKSWQMPDGSVVNLPGNMPPPEGARPFANPWIGQYAGPDGIPKIAGFERGTGQRVWPSPLTAPPPGAMQTTANTAAVTEDLFSRIDKISQNPKLSQWTGPLQGINSQIWLATGKNPMAFAGFRKDEPPPPELVELATDLEFIRSAMVRTATGLQANEAELKNIKAAIPTLMTPFNTWNAKFGEARKYINDIQMRNTRMSEQPPAKSNIRGVRPQ